jgi:hypothetical protein
LNGRAEFVIMARDDCCSGRVGCAEWAIEPAALHLGAQGLLCGFSEIGEVGGQIAKFVVARLAIMLRESSQLSERVGLHGQNCSAYRARRPCRARLYLDPAERYNRKAGQCEQQREKQADVAQLVEQLIRNQQVVSSSLTVGSRIR